MNRIETYSNWCSIDRLDDIDLQDGERLRLRWPDGTIEEVTVLVEKTPQPVYCMRSDESTPVHRAYARIDHHGAEAKARIVGLEAERITPPIFMVKCGECTLRDGHFCTNKTLPVANWLRSLAQDPHASRFGDGGMTVTASQPCPAAPDGVVSVVR